VFSNFIVTVNCYMHFCRMVEKVT